jgi:hypothetical protein
MQLSPNFSLEEMIQSQTALRLGIDNTPSDLVVTHLQTTCAAALEPVRTLLGVPLHVDSGYRSLALNKAVGGSPLSAHCVGYAADIIPIGLDLRAAFDQIRNSAIVYDQLILECNAWIHIGLSEDAPRRQNLLAQGTPGHWTYTEA